MCKNSIMAIKSIYSHTFLVGRLNASHLTPEQLVKDTEYWEKEQLTELEFNNLKANYYSAHVDAMLDTNNRLRPDFLQEVCCFRLNRHAGIKPDRRCWFNGYHCIIKSVKIHFFPCNISLFSIEIDDSGVDLDKLTFMHNQWKELKGGNEQFDNLMQPLVKATGVKDVSELTYEGTKMRMYQIVQTNNDKPLDDLLFELGTFSPIGVVMSPLLLPEEKRILQPSDSYYKSIVGENEISVFSNWKALALNDSFTVLGVGANFNPWTHENHYFPLIYLRALFEEFFCFDRNNRYRGDKDGWSDDVRQQLADIRQMERYYFYDDISYNFLPSLLYQFMANGLGLKSDREELTQHIKEALREENNAKMEKEERKKTERNNRIIIVLTAMAAVSALGPLFDALGKIFDCDGMNWTIVVILTLLIGGFVAYIIWFARNEKIRTLKGRKGKKMYLITSKTVPNVSIKMSEEVRTHIMSHFDDTTPGSRFAAEEPEILLQKILDHFPDVVGNAPVDADGRKRITLKFTTNIGTSNVVAVSTLTEEERDTIHTVQRGKCLVRCAFSSRHFPTNECQLVLSANNDLVTVYPGEFAPPLPQNPGISNPYWDNHVFIQDVE